jgi:predicted lactoylglutathione lyase
MIKPEPKLGGVAAITITSGDLETSLRFYELLGFSQVAAGTFPFPWIQISDGSLLVMLRKETRQFCSLTYYCKQLDELVAQLQSDGFTFTLVPGPQEMIRRFVFQSPGGFNIALVTFVDGFVRPTGFTALTLPPNDFFEPSRYPNKSCGIFGEFAHPVKDLDLSVRFWERLGFACGEIFSDPYPWTIMTDGLSVIGLHQTDSFDYPVITYFASDQPSKIEKLKAAGLTGFTDKGHGSVTLTTPEGQHINLFKIGM